MFDQNFLFMAFLMLCFAGLATMFYFLMRNIDELTRMLKEDRNQMQTNLRALESSLNHLGDLLSRLTADPSAPRGAAPLRSDPLRPDPLRPDPLRPAPAPGMAAPIQMADAGFGARPQARPAVSATRESQPLRMPAPDENLAAPGVSAPQAAGTASSGPGASTLPDLSLNNGGQARRR